MTNDHTGAVRPAALEVVLHEERLQTSVERVPVERVVLRRRITSQVRQVEVTVHREELQITREPLRGRPTTATGPPQPSQSSQPPLVLVLSEEVPVVSLQARPYEQVTVHLDTVTDQQQITETLSREQAELLTEPAQPTGS